jgi:hypothetical protein
MISDGAHPAQMGQKVMSTRTGTWELIDKGINSRGVKMSGGKGGDVEGPSPSKPETSKGNSFLENVGPSP